MVERSRTTACQEVSVPDDTINPSHLQQLMKIPMLRLVSLGILSLLSMVYGETPTNSEPPLSAPVTTNPPAQATPSIAPDDASLKSEATRKIDAKYEEWKSTLSPERRKWEETLDATLGSFYLPGRKSDVVSGKPDAWDFVEDDPNLPRVLLIGDSISRGYTMDVRKALAGKANVHRAPENCGSSTRGLKNLSIYLGDEKWDVIHFNFGIHDRNAKPDEYTANLEQIISGLDKSGAKLIWARTTPSASATNNEHYSPEQCVKLNETADAVMMKHGIPEDDLYTLVQPRLAELQLTNNVHFNDQGYALLGNQVASSILMVLGGGTNGVLAAPSPSATSLPNAIALPKDSEKDSRLKPDGKGWGLEEAVITDPTLPRVLLIGDSILGGYKKLVTTSLSGKANVDSWKNPNFQSEEFNKKLALVLEHGPYDVIHFNVGLHGWQKDRIKEGTYKPLTKELVELMKAKCPDAKLIWANTTPVTIKGNPSHLDPVINDIIVEHNRMAAEVMQEENVPVEDFYGLLIGKLPLARGDQFHWQPGGYVILANAATASILQALPDSKKQ